MQDMSRAKLQYITCEVTMNRKYFFIDSNKFWNEMNFPYQEGLLIYQGATPSPSVSML